MKNNQQYSFITCNSKEVKPGSLFVAIKGLKFNGEDYVEEALAKGASTIVVSSEFKGKIIQNKIIKVENPRKYLSLAAKEFFLRQPENIVAVTGTNGKTSTANFFKQICNHIGFKSASIGTLGVVCDEVIFNNNDALTSPDPVKLHEILQTLADNKVTHVSLEASSHGLDQYRLDGVDIKAGALTNLTRDHLDYHSSMEKYFEAKLRLFTELVKETAVINADIPEFNVLYSRCKEKNLRIISYGKKGGDIKLIDYNNSSLILDISGIKYKTAFNILGEFQIYNVMCALGLAVSVGIETKSAISTLPTLSAVSGRLEYIGEVNQAKVFVDFAHKPDALANVLNSLRNLTKGNIHVVFGCGGDRDQGKRAIMGEIAQELADIVIVTDDNPRTEDPAKIRSQILESCPKAIEVVGRSQAIKIALNQLKPYDVLVIAGKGHEDYQIIGIEKIHFSDQEEVRKHIKQMS